MRNFIVPFSTIVGTCFVLAIMVALVEHNAPDSHAQQAWQPIAGTQRVVGHHPARVERERGVYQVKQKWIPGSMAVYLDGKRVSEPEDYIVAPAMNRIHFGRLANDRSVVIVDYEPR